MGLSHITYTFHNPAAKQTLVPFHTGEEAGPDILFTLKFCLANLL